MRISTDSTVNPEDGISYYIVEATVPNESLQSYKGKRRRLKLECKQKHLLLQIRKNSTLSFRKDKFERIGVET